MAEPFLSEIRLMSFNFPPKGWAFCNGQFLPINQNQALFSLLGTTYGGNGQTTFALPNLRGRTPMHMGDGFTLGQAAGSTAVTLSIDQLPQHLHFLQASSSDGNSLLPFRVENGNPVGNILAKRASEPYRSPLSKAGEMNAASVTKVGGSLPHNNMQPYLVLNFCIALQGIFPSQN